MTKMLFFLAATAATAAAGSSRSSHHDNDHKSSKEAAAAGSAPSEDFIKGFASFDGPAGGAATPRAFDLDEFTPGPGAAASKHAGQQAPLPWAQFEGPFRSFLEGGSLPGAAAPGLGKAPTELAASPADGEPEQAKLQQSLAPFGATSMKAGTEVSFSGADLARDLAKSHAGAAWAASDLSRVRFGPQHLPALAGAHEALTDLQSSMSPFQFVAAKGGEASAAAGAGDAKATVRQARAAVESALGKYGIRFEPPAKKPSTVELAADAPAGKDGEAAKKDAWTVNFSNWMDGLKAVMKNVHKQMEERARSHKGGDSAEQMREQAKEQKDEQAKEQKEQKDEHAKEQKEQKDEHAKEKAEQKGEQAKQAAEGRKEAKKKAEEKGGDDEKAAPAKKAEEKKEAEKKGADEKVAAAKDASGEADDKKGAKPEANPEAKRGAHVSAVGAFLAAREVPPSATAAAPVGGLAALVGLAVVAAVRRRRQQSAAEEPLLYASLD